LRGFGQLEIKPDVRPEILKDNAARLRGLAG
jgi:predicted TIM-barrel fold metal-dependent hydrolase